MTTTNDAQESVRCRECGREHSGLTTSDYPTQLCEACAPVPATTPPEGPASEPSDDLDTDISIVLHFAYAAALAREPEGPDALLAAQAAGRVQIKLDRLATQAASLAALRCAATELLDAAKEVNARYIGGSPLNGKLGDAIGKLAVAHVKVRRALTETQP